MKCNDIRENLSMLLDQELSKKDSEAFLDHIDNCPACKALYDDMKFMKEIMEDMPEMALPQGFENELHGKLVEAAREMSLEEASQEEIDIQEPQHEAEMRKVIRIPLPNFRDFKRHSKPLTAIAATMVIAVLAFGSGNLTDKMQMGAPEEAMYDMATESVESAEVYEMDAVNEAAPRMAANLKMASDDGAMTLGSAEAPMAEEAPAVQSLAVTAAGVEQTAQEPRETSVETAGRMIIYSADIYLDIVNYDETYESIVQMVGDMGGYVEDASTSFKYYDELEPENSLKYGRLTVRIPRTRFTGTVDYLGTVGIQKNLNIWSQDITAQYRDISNEVANLEVRESKLREIMDKAEEVEDIITVERELSRVRGEINSYMGTLKNWESLVSMSTVHIDLNEVESLEPKIKPIDKTLLQKAKDGFVTSINQLKYMGERVFVGLVAFFPKLIIWCCIFFIGYKIVKWLIRKFRK